MSDKLFIFLSSKSKKKVVKQVLEGVCLSVPRSLGSSGQSGWVFLQLQASADVNKF